MCIYDTYVYAYPCMLTVVTTTAHVHISRRPYSSRFVVYVYVCVELYVHLCMYQGICMYVCVWYVNVCTCMLTAVVTIAYVHISLRPYSSRFVVIVYICDDLCVYMCMYVCILILCMHVYYSCL